MLAGTPIIVLREGAQAESGRDARKAGIAAARALADAVRTTLGPRGMDKMLVDSQGDVTITNDGATIIQEMEVAHPAAKMIAEVAKAQDQECGDGTKTAVLLSGELLHQAEDLLDQEVHPTIVVAGYRLAESLALATLERSGRSVDPQDTALLEQVASTAMMSKGVAALRSSLSALAVEAVRSVLGQRDGRPTFDRKDVQIVRRAGGMVLDTALIHGHVLPKGTVHPAMPKQIEPVRIALVEGALEVKKTEFSAEIRITDPAQVPAFAEAEEALRRSLADAVIGSGARLIVCQNAIDPVLQERLARAGVYAVERVSHDDLVLTGRATGAQIVARGHELSPSDLGSARRVEERQIGEDHLTVISGGAGTHSVALLIRGGTEHVVAEVERSLVDALATVGAALEDGRVVIGAGATPMELALALRAAAPSIGGREQLAVEAYARALEAIPVTLAENAGMVSLDTLLELRKRHSAGEVDCGVDVLGGRLAPMASVAVEPARVFRQALGGATDAAAMLLRISDVISARRSTAGSRPAAH